MTKRAWLEIFTDKGNSTKTQYYMDTLPSAPMQLFTWKKHNFIILL